MSLGLQATKRRIVSVNATKKITKAMELVATAKLKTWKDQMLKATGYASQMEDCMMRCFARLSDSQKEAFFATHADVTARRLVVIVTSSLGLCGGYNYNLYKQLRPFLQKDDVLLMIGSKGAAYFGTRGYTLDTRYIDLFANFQYQKARLLAEEMVAAMQLGKYRSIHFASTHFRNSIVFEPRIETLFPLQPEAFNAHIWTQKEKDMLLEPSCEVLMKAILPLYMKSLVYARLVESNVSEQAARRNAMEAATDNAQEIVNQLQLQYNKARQGAITQEITEVVSGANALG